MPNEAYPSRHSNRWRWPMWGAIVALLLVPVIGMQVSDEFQWDAADFALAGLLLVGAGAIFELATVLVRDRKARFAIAGALAFAVFVIWLDAAAGIA